MKSRNKTLAFLLLSSILSLPALASAHSAHHKFRCEGLLQSLNDQIFAASQGAPNVTLTMAKSGFTDWDETTETWELRLESLTHFEGETFEGSTTYTIVAEAVTKNGCALISIDTKTID